MKGKLVNGIKMSLGAISPSLCSSGHKAYTSGRSTWTASKHQTVTPTATFYKPITKIAILHHISRIKVFHTNLLCSLSRAFPFFFFILIFSQNCTFSRLVPQDQMRRRCGIRAQGRVRAREEESERKRENAQG